MKSLYQQLVEIKILISKLEELQDKGLHSSQDSCELAEQLIGKTQQLENRIWFLRTTNKRYSI